MRHGEAESAAKSDRERRLTPTGEREVVAVVGQLAKVVIPTRMIASPYVRAQQTAALVQGLSTNPGSLETWREIDPSGHCESVLDKLDRSKAGELMLVTHQPFISRFIFYLTGVEISMGTASMALIQLHEMVAGCGEVEWVIHSDS